MMRTLPKTISLALGFAYIVNLLDVYSSMSVVLQDNAPGGEANRGANLERQMLIEGASQPIPAQPQQVNTVLIQFLCGVAVL